MRAIRLIIFIATCLFILVHISHAAWVIERDDRVFILDRTGEKWDVTQARELGFIPRQFQFGIGKDAFTPLVDDDLTDSHPIKSDSTRVIGVDIAGDAHAYDVLRLAKHEIANTTLSGQPIAAGY